MINVDIQENWSICYKLREIFQNQKKKQKIAYVKKAKIKPDSIQTFNINLEDAIEQIQEKGQKWLHRLSEKWFDINKRDKKWNTILKLSSLYWFEKTVKILLEEWADPNKKDFLWRTPLMLPASIWYKKIVKYILTYWGDPYLEDNCGYNVFDRLEEKGDDEMISFILNFQKKL